MSFAPDPFDLAVQQALEQARDISIAEFAESDAFCNRRLFPRQQVLLKILFLEELEGWEEDVLTGWINGEDDVLISPMVRERMQLLRDDGYWHFGEFDSVGGRRASKNFIAGITAARIMYEVQKLGDPGAHYDIDPTKEIYFSGIAVSLDQSKKNIYSDFANTMTGCKPLQPHLGKILEETFRVHTDADRDYVEKLTAAGIDVARDFSKLRVQALPANARSIRGITSMFITFDEMAFMMEGESASTGEECYSAAEPSVRQFKQDGMIICQSSPYSKQGKFYEQFQSSLRIDNGEPALPHMLGFAGPSWALYKGYDKDPRKQRWGHRPFKGAIMPNPDLPDDQLSPDDLIEAKKARRLERANPEKFAIEYRARWAEVLDAYLDPRSVDRAFHPVVIIPGGNPDRTDFAKKIQMRLEGSYELSFAGHCDPSSTTAGFGLAIGHDEYMPDPEFLGRSARHVILDFVKRWDPADFPGHTIDYLKVQAEIADYIDWFRPKEFTFDQYQSQAPMQFLRKEMTDRGIYESRVFEINNTNIEIWNQWETLKTALNMGLVHVAPDCPDSEYLQKELKFLHAKITSARVPKVDKQTVGPVQSKDMADALREVVFKFLGQLLQNFAGEELASRSLETGAQQGYQIGGRQTEGPMNFGEFYSHRQGAAQPRSRGRSLRGR